MQRWDRGDGDQGLDAWMYPSSETQGLDLCTVKSLNCNEFCPLYSPLESYSRVESFDGWWVDFLTHITPQNLICQSLVWNLATFLPLRGQKWCFPPESIFGGFKDWERLLANNIGSWSSVEKSCWIWGHTHMTCILKYSSSLGFILKSIALNFAEVWYCCPMSCACWFPLA